MGMRPWVLIAFCVACSRGAPEPLFAKRSPGSPGYVRWKGVVMSGDDGIQAFDNGREAIGRLWLKEGVRASDVRHLSVNPAFVGAENSIQSASADALDQALAALAPKKGDGCLVHITSHGTPWGIHLRDQDPLSPQRLARILDRRCGSRPTAVFVSACYSGVFAGALLDRPQRVILTAARDDRPSFGCGVDDVYTFWDGCVLETLPTQRTWKGFAERLRRCIRAKESGLALPFSYPQALIGKRMMRLPLLNSVRRAAH